jgi:hypothetical protein
VQRSLVSRTLFLEAATSALGRGRKKKVACPATIRPALFASARKRQPVSTSVSSPPVATTEPGGAESDCLSLLGGFAAALLSLLAVAYGLSTCTEVRADQINQLDTAISLSEKAPDRFFVESQARLHELSFDLEEEDGLAHRAGDGARVAGPAPRRRLSHQPLSGAWWPRTRRAVWPGRAGRAAHPTAGQPVSAHGLRRGREQPVRRSLGHQPQAAGALSGDAVRTMATAEFHNAWWRRVQAPFALAFAFAVLGLFVCAAMAAR